MDNCIINLGFKEAITEEIISNHLSQTESYKFGKKELYLTRAKSKAYTTKGINQTIKGLSIQKKRKLFNDFTNKFIHQPILYA